jgi:hypothetical protein
MALDMLFQPKALPSRAVICEADFSRRLTIQKSALLLHDNPCPRPSKKNHPFFAVNPLNTLVIVAPAFRPQQDLKAGEAVPQPRPGDAFNALPHGAIVARMTL